MDEISNKLRTMRDELNLTQQDAAVMLGVSRITYIKWETDPGTMPLGKYEQLMRELERLIKLKEDIEG